MREQIFEATPGAINPNSINQINVEKVGTVGRSGPF